MSKFYQNDNLSTYCRVLFTERYESADDEMLEEMRIKLSHHCLDVWFDNILSDILGVSDKNLRQAICNSIDFENVMEDIISDLGITSCPQCHLFMFECDDMNIPTCFKGFVCDKCDLWHKSQCTDCNPVPVDVST